MTRKDGTLERDVTQHASDRIPPYDEGSERGLLGSILVDLGNSLDLCVTTGITADSFYIPAHRAVYNAMIECRTAGRPVDLLTVTSRLSEMDRMDGVGGNAFFDRLMDDTPTAAHAEFYADIVRQKHGKRRQIEIGRALERAAFDPDETIEAAVAAAQTEMFRLLGTVDTPTTNNDAILECYDQWKDAAKGKPHGLPCHIMRIQNTLGMFKYGKPYFIGAPPAGGKTTFMCNLVKHWAIGDWERGSPVPVAVYSGEMTHSEIIGNIVCEHADISKFALDHGMPEPMDSATKGTRMKRALDAAAAVVDPKTGMDRIPLFITDKEMNIEEICAWTRLMVHQHGIKALCIDYVQAIEPPPNIRGTEREKLVYVAQKIRALAKTLNIVIIILSQLSDGDGSKKGVDKALFGSKALEQVAYGIIMLYEEGGQAYAHIKKNRGGATGQIEVVFEKSRQRWRGPRVDECPKGGGSVSDDDPL